MRAAPFARAVRMSLVIAVIVIAGIAVSGCGTEPQSANAETGTWTVDVEEFKFPTRQPLGTAVKLQMKIRNTDTRDIENLSVILGGLAERVDQQNAETHMRPIWVMDDVRKGEATAYNSLAKQTFRLGPLKAGEVKTFKIGMTPIRRGRHIVTWEIATNLFGTGKAVNADGEPAAGSKTVAIDPTPQFDESVFD